MAPTITHLPLENETEEHFVHIITDLLSPAECSALISAHNKSMTEHDFTLTVRQRDMFDDEELAHLLWQRLAEFYQDFKVFDDEGHSWTASDLNGRFRFCRYEKGGAFAPHTDGRRLSSLNSQSFLTVNIYLNTVPTEHGGSTRVLAASPSLPHHVLAHIHPARGSVAIFRDSLFHDGAELLVGEKILLRSDVMFERDEAYDLDTVCKRLGEAGDDEKKGKRALAMAIRLEDGRNMEEAVGWYKRAFKIWPGLEKGEG